MDNSQSSEIFSNNEDFLHDSPAVEMHQSQMDAETYGSLVLKTKLSLSRNPQDAIHISEFPDHFTSLLEDCGACISQSLNLVINLLSESDVQLIKLCEYIEDAVSMLQILSSYIKSMIESIKMSCSGIKTFPTITGHMILVVFSHCKDSEAIYGHQLKYIKSQLKDLFQNCHELQLTYLMILEKHFTFDFSMKDEVDILIEALETNLKIGEIVQTLDVKTMAEQWKAFSMICEKYSVCLGDKHIYHNCTKILCTMIENNLKTAIEVEQDDKIILRSLKVASFTIKILLRICNIFKHATSNNHVCVVELLSYIYLNLNLAEKSPQFHNLMTINISNPAEALLRELLKDAEFVNCVLNVELNEIKHDDKLLGYTLLMVSVIKSVLLHSDDCKVPKQTLIQTIFKLLPFGNWSVKQSTSAAQVSQSVHECHTGFGSLTDHKSLLLLLYMMRGHICFNMNLKFRTTVTGYETCGLYEHFLTHTLALASALGAQEISCLEQKIYEALLSTDCYSAMFSSNLWILLARLSTRQYLLSQVISLCKVYKKLENHKLFSKSPQQIHLSFTMSRLFETMHDEDKMIVYRQFNIHDKENVGLWVVLKIKNLPTEAQNNAEKEVTDTLNREFHKLFTGSAKNLENIQSLKQTMQLVITCSRVSEDTLADNIVRAWMKACSKQNKPILSRELARETVWYLDYIEALISLTNSMECIFNSRSNTAKVLHVVSNIIEKGSAELKLYLTNLVLKISTNNSIRKENQHSVDLILVRTFKNLLQDSENIVKFNFFEVLRKYRHNINIDDLMSKVLIEDDSLQKTWNYIIDGRTSKNLDVKGILLATIDFEYCHKCVEGYNVIELSGSSVVTIEKTNSNNFDFADIDTLFEPGSDSELACKNTLFETGSDSEPAYKKMKLDSDDIDDILTRLESDTKLLCKAKENEFTSQYNKRIRKLCEKLRNIVE